MLGPYRVQDTIAAVHAEAARAADTDWPRILALHELHELLEQVSGSPITTLNRVIAVAMAQGVHAGLDLLAILTTNERLIGH